MSITDAVVLGVVEGVTEFLPISSTGHLILTSYLLGIPDTEFLKSFLIAIQLGAIGAVIALYWRSFLNLEILKRILAGFLPTALIGALLYSFIKSYLIGNEYVVIIALIVGGIILIVFELMHKEDVTMLEDISNMSYKQAVGVGLFQAIAVIPGVSRSGASILGGLLLGLRRTTIVEFSFLLAVPTMLAATTLDIAKSYSVFSIENVSLLAVGFIVAFFVALVVVRFFLRYIRTHTFITFGIYRITIAFLFWLFILA